MTMSASPKTPAQEPAQGDSAAGASDPSMEDILASIRRILSEDESAGSTAPVEHKDVSDDVLLLESSMMVTETEPGPDLGSDAAPDPVLPTPVETAASPAPSVAPEPSRVPDGPIQQAPAPQAAALQGEATPAEPLLNRLVAPAAAAAAASSVGTLVRTIAAERSMQVYSGGPTLEDIVRAELRPQLKQWLDENLPPMVERLVRAEIERVIGREIL